MITPGTIRIAPPDHHLLVRGDRLRVVRGPRENLHRPAIDPLFRSAALERDGHEVAAVVLSGALDDGTAGAVAVHRAGGTVVIQDPSDAAVPSMPRSVAGVLTPDLVLRAGEIGPALEALMRNTDRRSARTLDQETRALMEAEIAVTAMDREAVHDEDRPGTPSGFGCPDCQGSLFEIDETAVPRFRCRTGHAYSAQALIVAQDAALEEAMWSGLRALEEQAALATRLIERVRPAGSDRLEERLSRRVTESRERAERLRQFLLDASSAQEPLGGTDELSIAAMSEREAARAGARAMSTASVSAHAVPPATGTRSARRPGASGADGRKAAGRNGGGPDGEGRN
jgi:two-component system chemotaxis response regulator CheB